MHVFWARAAPRKHGCEGTAPGVQLQRLLVVMPVDEMLVWVILSLPTKIDCSLLSLQKTADYLVLSLTCHFMSNLILGHNTSFFV